MTEQGIERSTTPEGGSGGPAGVTGRRKSRALVLGAATAAIATAVAVTVTAPAAQAAPGKSYEIAFQRPDQRLAVVGSDNTARDLSQGPLVAQNSDPSITALPGPAFGFALKYRLPDGHLGTYDSSQGVPVTGSDFVASGSSPSTALRPFGQGATQTYYENTLNELQVQNGVGRGLGLGFQVMSGSSPANAWNASGSMNKVAVVSANGFLRQSTNGSAFDSEGINVPVTPGTSPAVAASTSDAAIAVNGLNGSLMVTRSSDRSVNDTGLPVRSDSSPAVAALSTGGFETAFVAPDNTLMVLDAAGNPHSTGQKVVRFSNPAIAADDHGGWKIVYSALDEWGGDVGTLSTYDSTGHVVHTQASVQVDTSPAIAYVTPAAVSPTTGPTPSLPPLR